MHKEILTEEQLKLVPTIGRFYPDFGLVGGTAIALHIGHRRSIDFDMFTANDFSNARIKGRLKRLGWKISRTLKEETGQFTFIINGVQLTFYNYPYPIAFTEKFEKKIMLPDLLTLAAMKAYALGQRAKWKDYVDLYFIISKYHNISDITARAKEIFAGEFNERIFRETLPYFDDINYGEPVEYLPGFAVSEKKVKAALVKYAVA